MKLERLEEKFEKLYQIFINENFLSMKALGGEIPFYISSYNPNVMLELGVRLAFNKPTIIIKDEQTKYIFDIGLIRTLEYDSAFMYEKVIKFHENLKNTINEK